MDVRPCPDNSSLFEYLYAQDMETIKIIETVMYIGRDYQSSYLEMEQEYLSDEIDLEDTSGTTQIFHQVSSPNDLILEWLDDFNGVSGWKSKRSEVNQIYSKLPLHEYLKRAFTILGINLDDED